MSTTRKIKDLQKNVGVSNLRGKTNNTVQKKHETHKKLNDNDDDKTNFN